MSISTIIVNIKLFLTCEYIWTKHFIILTKNIHKYYVLNRKLKKKKHDFNLLIKLNPDNNYGIFYAYTHDSYMPF